MLKIFFSFCMQMRRALWIAIVVAIVCLLSFLRSRNGASFPVIGAGASSAPMHFPGMHALEDLGQDFAHGFGVGGHRGTAAPTSRPESVPPYTLGPVPNGLTRVPEPPTLQPYADSELVETADTGATLYDMPAASAAASIDGMAVPAVQDPWNTESWKFLVGSKVDTAVRIVNNLFPSFPISARSVSEGPLMSGAVVLKYDSNRRVVAVVRD